MSRPTQSLSLIVALAESPQRCEAARTLATSLGVEDLIIFVIDPEIGVLLPAPGFQQTLPSGRSWRALLAGCVKAGQYTAEVPFPTAETIKPVTAIKGEDGTVLALVGGSPRLDKVSDICLLLPLLGAAFRGERSVLIAEGQTALARAAAAQAGALAETLDTTRSELERALKAAEAASRAKDEFLATVSHELRTPLTAVLGWAHILRANQLDEAGRERALETIERNARAQNQLIEDLLDISRIITGKLRLDVRPIDPATLIESAIEAVHPAAQAKGIRIQKVMDTGVSAISGDPARLQQVVWNLLSNAIKFTPKGGRVQVRLESINSHIEIIVTDTGAGIKAEFLPFVFDRFRQADGTTTRAQGGMGIGLAIVRQLVELHGGEVYADSHGEGQGASFTVKLPLIPVYQRHDAEEPVHPRADVSLAPVEFPERLDGLRVLIVDDEADTRELLRAMLAHCGADVTAATSAEAALAQIGHSHFHLLISDIGMPGADGYELIRRVRSLPEEDGGRIPAIALTAYARAEDRLRSLRAGYQMHVAKPVETAELIAAAASLAKRGNI